MSSYNKYVTGGGINPFWIREQCEARDRETNNKKSNISDLLSGLDLTISIKHSNDETCIHIKNNK